MSEELFLLWLFDCMQNKLIGSLRSRKISKEPGKKKTCNLIGTMKALEIYG